MKRTRRPKGALVAWWDHRESDLHFAWDRRKADGHLLYGAIGPLAKELEKRGYDITTIKFSIQRPA
jgi:hypothetical protein